MTRGVLTSLRRALESPDPDEAAAAVAELERAIGTEPTDDATATAEAGLRQLRAKRRFPDMLRTGEAAARARVTTPAVACFYAQALIEERLTEPALRILETARPRAGAMAGEVEGLIGRAHKQRFVESPDGPAAELHLRRAVEAYLGRYRAAPAESLWHGINAVALLARADRDGMDVGDGTDWSAVATELLTSVESLPGDQRDGWNAAIAAEALVALGRYQEAGGWLTTYTNTVENDAFEFASTRRQLGDVWQLDATQPEQRALLEFLTARLVRANGADIDIPRPAATAAAIDADSQYLEAVFGEDQYQSVKWYRAGLEASKSVVRIVRPLGATVGTGFLVPGDVLHPGLGPALVVVTNFHVANRDGTHPGRPPDQLRVIYEDQGPEIPLAADVAWQSPLCPVGTNPPTSVDTTVLRPAAPPPSAPSYIARTATRPQLAERLYVIGYPLGEYLAFSLQDNKIVGASDELLHYRSPTRPGSSGSPLFDSEWQLVGLHHAGKENLARIDDPDATYAANEGFLLTAVQAAMRRDPPV
jgi:hypothetical protein